MRVRLEMATLSASELLRTNILSIFISLSIFLPLSSMGQKYNCFDCLRKQKKVGIDLIGASYRTETPVKNRFTYIFHGGLQYSFVITSGNIIEKYYYSLDAVVASGIRYYYHMSSIRKNNVGHFFEIDTGVKSGSLISKNFYYPAYVYLRPHWGMQFPAGDWGTIEFATGVTAGSSVIKKYKGVAVAPNIQFRIAYILKNRRQTKHEL
jgi:hypothetical protein